MRLSSAPRSATIDGAAMFVIVESIRSIASARSTTIRMSHTLRAEMVGVWVVVMAAPFLKTNGIVANMFVTSNDGSMGP
jgi:hypothetical protein